MLISHDHKFIFIHIGKTGGTSIEKTLCAALDIDFEQTKKDAEGHWWKHIWAKGMRKRVGPQIWDDYFTFAFVRNPYDMILSLYSMYTQYPEYIDPEQYPHLYHPWNQYKDFADFIQAMGEQRYEPDEKWRLQLDKLSAADQFQVWNSLKNLQTSYLTESWMGMDGPGEILVDFVGRFERLQEDFDQVCDRIGIGPLQLINHGATQHRPFASLYNPAMAKIVEEHFAIDIQRWGYSLPGLNNG